MLNIIILLVIGLIINFTSEKNIDNPNMTVPL